jgi:hypothetical protein
VCVGCEFFLGFFLGGEAFWELGWKCEGRSFGARRRIERRIVVSRRHGHTRRREGISRKDPGVVVEYTHEKTGDLVAQCVRKEVQRSRNHHPVPLRVLSEE